MKRIITYIKDVKDWADSYYPKGWLWKKEFRKTRIRNALYCVSPWKAWDKIICFFFG